MLCRGVAWLMLSLSLLVGQLAMAEAGWLQVHPPSTFVDRNGVSRHTGCASAPTSQSADFSFIFREGDPRRLVIGFDGGGACWDNTTCLGSMLRGSPVYQTDVDETPARLDALGGLFDQTNSENPLHGSLQVLIPYCTGDLHMGSNDQEYVLGSVTHTIRHRGYDNMIAVLEWIADYYSNGVGTPPTLLVITGASAGGYGAHFAYPAIHRLFPASTRKRVFSDSTSPPGLTIPSSRMTRFTSKSRHADCDWSTGWTTCSIDLPCRAATGATRVASRTARPDRDRGYADTSIGVVRPRRLRQVVQARRRFRREQQHPRSGALNSPAGQLRD